MAAGLTAVTIMDDKRTPTAIWLAFSLGLPKATQLCNSLRHSMPAVNELGNLVERFIQFPDEWIHKNLISAAEAAQFKRSLNPEIRQRVACALEWEARSPEHHLVPLDHPVYPELLRNTDYAPPVLYAKGNLSALEKPLVAIVGSRKASHAALAHTRNICLELAAQGIGIVSGLAIGIDAAAHEGALSAGGITIAVAATEPDRVYPAKHVNLSSRIISGGGLILTEYPIGSITRPWFFPRRNRIISGLSLGVVVAEAALPSGSLTTAIHAMNQGREVMAVPGSIHNLQAKGCHALIKQGAALVETTQDVLDTLESSLQRVLQEWPTSVSIHQKEVSKTNSNAVQKQIESLSDQDKWILEHLSAQAATVDDLMTQATSEAQGFTVSALNTALGWLEIKGLILCETGGRYARC
ncbi:MAG: DNA processing protein [Gammaproteobacteria bacterium]